MSFFIYMAFYVHMYFDPQIHNMYINIYNTFFASSVVVDSAAHCSYVIWDLNFQLCGWQAAEYRVIYIYIYIYREREREVSEWVSVWMVCGFHCPWRCPWRFGGLRTTRDRHKQQYTHIAYYTCSIPRPIRGVHICPIRQFVPELCLVSTFSRMCEHKHMYMRLKGLFQKIAVSSAYSWPLCLVQ